MELKKANLHMDRMKCQLSTQITLEEDKNINDRSPDATGILMEKGKVVIEEIRPLTDCVYVRGKLQYEILCSSPDPLKRLFGIRGELNFEEKIRVEGLENTDNPMVRARVEDLRSTLINSRKINIRALIDFEVNAKELYDEEILFGIEENENVEIKMETFFHSVLVVDKKDIYRIKEDLELPSFLPPIQEVLWKNVELGKVDVKILEDAIGLQGDVRIFVLYESIGEKNQIKSYETTIPFSGNVECMGCGSAMIGDIVPYVSYQNLSIKEDYDGEDRMLELDMVLELPIQIYENREMERVSDIYGTRREVLPEYKRNVTRVIGDKCYAKVKVREEVKSKNLDRKILQVCHMNSSLFVEDGRWTEDGLKIEGYFNVAILYMEDGEMDYFEVMKKEIPFTYVLENPNFTKSCKWKITPFIEQQNCVILDENSVEVKATLGMEVFAEEERTYDAISGVIQREFPKEIMDERGAIVVYIPAKKEELWEIGKRYQIPLEVIKQVNEISGKEVEGGKKIILVRSDK